MYGYRREPSILNLEENPCKKNRQLKFLVEVTYDVNDEVGRD